MIALCPARLLTPQGFEQDRCVLIEGGLIAGVVPVADCPPGAERRDLGGDLLPGFIDLQVNGGGGVLFNDAPTPAALARIDAAHRRFGTTGFLATLITTDRMTMARAADAVRAALAAGTPPGLLGLHFEGPHLNPAAAASMTRILSARSRTTATSTCWHRPERASRWSRWCRRGCGGNWGWRNLRLVQRAHAGVGAPAEITP